MTASSPDDFSEQQASGLADQVSVAPVAVAGGLARQGAEEGEMPEDEKELQMSASINRQTADEEELPAQ